MAQLTKMPQNAVVPEQVCLQQPIKLSETFQTLMQDRSQY